MHIRTYEEFLNLTIKEVNDLVHDAVIKNKVAVASELANWIAKARMEHFNNFINISVDDAKNLYEYARGGK